MLLLSCCHCERWSDELLKQRPYASYHELLMKAEAIWLDMGEADYLEAFSYHPEIGDIGALRDKYSAASKEQGQITSADEMVIAELYENNKLYKNKNGFIFIVCATGKSAEQMLAILVRRLKNVRGTEISNAANEQAKITRLRLGRIFE